MVQVLHTIWALGWFGSSRSRIGVYFLLWLASAGAFAQEVIQIDFEGNKKTKPDHLEIFLSTKIGSELDSASLEQDRQQLVNLELFSDAYYEVLEAGSGYHLVFHLTELKTLIPFVSFGGIGENFWTKVGISESNLGGRGYKLSAYHQYYDRHSVSINAQLNRFKGSPWGYQLDLVKWGTLEPLYFPNGSTRYNYDNYNAGFNIIRNFNFADKLLVGGSFFRETYEANETPVEGAPAYQQLDKSLLKLQWTSYHINSHFYYRYGFSQFYTAQFVHSFDGNPFFWIVFTELKGYKRNGARGNLAWRIKAGISSNNETPFAPFVLDSYLNIRGVGNRVDRGTGTVVLNMEYRHTLYDKNNLASQVVGFIDTGSWRLPGGKFDDFTNADNQRYFAGIGIRFIQQEIYNGILRLDYGWDLKAPDNNGIVIGIGQYF